MLLVSGLIHIVFHNHMTPKLSYIRVPLSHSLVSKSHHHSIVRLHFVIQFSYLLLLPNFFLIHNCYSCFSVGCENCVLLIFVSYIFVSTQPIIRFYIIYIIVHCGYKHLVRVVFCVKRYGKICTFSRLMILDIMERPCLNK